MHRKKSGQFYPQYAKTEKHPITTLVYDIETVVMEKCGFEIKQLSKMKAFFAISVYQNSNANIKNHSEDVKWSCLSQQSSLDWDFEAGNHVKDMDRNELEKRKNGEKKDLFKLSEFRRRNNINDILYPNILKIKKLFYRKGSFVIWPSFTNLILSVETLMKEFKPLVGKIKSWMLHHLNVIEKTAKALTAKFLTTEFWTEDQRKRLPNLIKKIAKKRWWKRSNPMSNKKLIWKNKFSKIKSLFAIISYNILMERKKWWNYDIISSLPVKRDSDPILMEEF